MRSHAAPRRPAAPAGGFTLIELVLVILVVLILAGLTIAVVGDTLDGDRVRGGASQVQNYLAGARDRAIYAASRQEDTNAIPPAIGVRFLPDQEMSIDDPTARGGRRHVAFGSMVFVQETAPLPTWLRVYLNDTVTPPRWEVSQLQNVPGQLPRPFETLAIRSVKSLIERGLIPSRWEKPNPLNTAQNQWTLVYYLPVYFDRDRQQEPYYIQFVDAPAPAGSLGGPGNRWLQAGVLSNQYFNTAQTEWDQEPCKLRLLPSVMPSEEPRQLPRGTVIDAESSRVAGIPIQDLLREDGSFDVLFNSRGVVEGPLAATGLIQFVLADAEDVQRGFRILQNDGSFAGPFVDAGGSSGWDDADGDGQFDERKYDVAIVSVRTQTGSVYVSSLNPEFDTATGLFLDPFRYAEIGGEAR